MSYKTDNEGFLTNSKLKVYNECKEKYEGMFITDLFPEQQKDCFEMGKAFEYLAYYGLETFKEKYLILQPREQRKKYLDDDRILFTNGDGQKILDAYEEILRHDVFEVFSKKYEFQKTFVIEYRGIKLKGTLDRYSEDGPIRDYKFVRDVDRFYKYEIFGGLQYIKQAAFYFLLVKIHTGKEKPVIFDVADKTEDVKSDSFEIPVEILRKYANELKQDIDNYIDTKGQEEELDISTTPCNTCHCKKICPMFNKKKFITITSP